jgi:tetratricopeptide (TPR) repeat protein
MYDTGVRQENRAAFPVDEQKTVVRNGNLWVPVETTLLGKAGRFEEAWIKGAENYHKQYRPEPSTVVETRTAWLKYPPASPPLAEARTPEIQVDRAAEDTRQLLAKYSERVSRLAGTGKDSGSLLRRGAALLKSGMFDRAEQAYEKASRKHKSFAVIYGLAASQAGQGNLLKALVSFQEALSRAKDNRSRFSSQLAIAQCYKVDGNLKKARLHLKKALELNPAARHDSRYRALIAYLHETVTTKAFGEEQTPQFFQEIISGL